MSITPGGSSGPAQRPGLHTFNSDQDIKNAAEELLQTSVLTSRLDAVIAWGRKNSLWPIPYGTACCGIELMSVMGPRYDLARFGAEVVRFSPRLSDLMIVA